MEKTYRDFVNEVITEISNKAQAHGTGFKNLMKKKDKKEDNSKEILKLYAKAFLIEHGNMGWNKFISALTSGGKKSVEVTKYQFMQAFFKFYFEYIFRKNAKLIYRCLEKSSETIGLEKKEYSIQTINKIYKVINKGQNNKKLFVEVFNSLCGGGW